MDTLLLALTLAAYARAMTIGHGSFGPLNMALLLAAVCGVGLFVLAETRAASPLIRLAMFRDPSLSASLAMSALVSTVMMATLVVGPFYRALARARRGDDRHQYSVSRGRCHRYADHLRRRRGSDRRRLRGAVTLQIRW